VSERAALGYSILRPFGPNDGLALLADELFPGVTPFVVPGVDHYVEHEDRDAWTAAVFRTLVAP